jgi:hypothetical protein
MLNRMGGEWAPRYSIVMPVTYELLELGKQVASRQAGQTRDLSLTGACLELDDRLPAGTMLGVHFERPAHPFALRAEVVWGPSGGGDGKRHGVVFRSLTPDQRQGLEALLKASGAAPSRVPLPQPANALAQSTTVQLLEISSGGVRIEHDLLLRPNFPCQLSLPSVCDSFSLPARVVRSEIIGAQLGPDGESRLRYQSGLAFIKLSPEQQQTLARIIAHFASAALGERDRVATLVGGRLAA